MRDGVIPAAKNCEKIAAGCNLNIVKEKIKTNIRYALCCGYTYGGLSAVGVAAAQGIANIRFLCCCYDIEIAADGFFNAVFRGWYKAVSHRINRRDNIQSAARGACVTQHTFRRPNGYSFCFLAHCRFYSFRLGKVILRYSRAVRDYQIDIFWRYVRLCKRFFNCDG